nr:hypothetical protein [Corynebacterium capitovis]
MSEAVEYAREPGDAPKRNRIRVRAWHVALLFLAVCTCLLLAWWQWTRFKSGTGTFQNLGYALQWPFFAGFFVYAYRTGIKMENAKIDAVNQGEALDDLYEADVARFGAAGGATDAQQPTSIDPDFLPERPQLDVEEYNELLAPRRQRRMDTNQ